MGEWSMPELGYLTDNEWHWTEKVDGTNVRIHWNGEKVSFGGRTEDAQMPIFLLYRLEESFPRLNFQTHFRDVSDVMLYGEGYGARIQKGGGNYKSDGVDFVLFDVQIGGVYLERENVEDIAAKMGLRVVPIVGKGSLRDAIDLTRKGFDSTWGPFKAEGLVMRPATELFTRRGHRIITKVKFKDFQ